jgi:hypothetical protein
MCDHHPSAARATILAAELRGITPEGDVCFSKESISIGRAFSPDQAHIFRSQDYVIDHSGELHLF